jgi:FlaG/FlaF family flagellin (archaellin)
MKKAILAIIATILLLSIIISACLTSHTQSINVVHEPSEASDENQQATNVKTTENGEKPQDVGETSTSCNQDCNLNDTEETENMQSVTSNNPSENPADTSQDRNTCRKVYPPDGRIYWTPEPPYAYIPTYTPKKPSLPIMLPELEN